MYKEIIKRTLDLLFEKKYILMRALFIPFLILSIIEYYSTHIMISKSTFYILTALSFLVTIVMSINVHRILLLSEEETPKWGVYKFGQREISFILKGIGLGLLMALVFFLVYFISLFIGKFIQGFFGSNVAYFYNILVVVVLVGFIGMITSRISLIFPSIAIDKPLDFGDALALSKNYKLLVFMMVIIFPILFATVVSFVYGLVIKFLMALISSDLSILYSLLNIFVTVFTIGFLSVTYEYIISKQPIIETQEKLNEIEFIDNENSFKMIIDDRYETTYEQLKEDLIKQYKPLGFDEIVVDKDTSFMLKNKDNQESYILVTHMNNEFIVETFNVKDKPILSID
ncbi:hypothetical protein Arnit_2855 [Arcobacter nitrofigilis DSM 7299]|uniref:Uncharacterized protein n=1 Tax=Arcobacter nitrofigilis (strain ATCC 33309 / DSM 7299 / CCUG 15893 / LMG 7604 / NCTC 12251 / CI) TaxID=572480 RepID=D5V783_ARCNC|nr:hypothetical protein [Arcobacter nitrofigilis]ADG94503.1 hypothetical protein Arnit_2855 [Arcobacter nitrofigilis DSM 7299]